MALPRSARFLTLVLAAIQFAAPAFVSVADGAFAKLVRDPGVHVEATGGTDCSPPHAADCAVCRFISCNVGEVFTPATIELPSMDQSAPADRATLGSGSRRPGLEARGPPASAGLI
jgi:hypothetical protein